MNVITENTLEVKSDIDNVYAFITNMENYEKWFPNVISIKSVDTLDHGTVGKNYIEKLNLPLKGETDCLISVKESSKNNIFITEGRMKPLNPKMVWVFTELAQGICKIEWTIKSKSKNRLFNLIFLPLIRKDLSKKVKQGFVKLKQIKETK